MPTVERPVPGQRHFGRAQQFGQFLTFLHAADTPLAFDADPAIGAIIITGCAKAFAAGADIAAMVDWTYMDVYSSEFITRNWETTRRVRKPVIAAVAALRWVAVASWRWPATS